MNDITALLVAWNQGDSASLAPLMEAIYAELRRLAAGYLRHERPNHTFQPTALVNEAFLRLIDQKHVKWQNRAHFFGIAAQEMRRILVDHARRHKAAKRGGEFHTIPLNEEIQLAANQSVNLVALDDALARLAEFDSRQSRIVELRFFTGLSIAETAEVLGISPATVGREWDIARAWLRRELGG